MRGPFKPPPDIEPLPPEQVAPTYHYWRWRQLYSTFIGYAVFYFVRKNIPVALPLMEKDLGVSKADLGKFLSLHDICYGVSKFVNGMLADRANPRYFMAVGLLISALTNIVFGLSTSLVVLGVFWVLNGWFQGMGFPPCARILSHWFAPRERGTKWGMWNTSHQVGAALILVLAGYLGQNFGWRSIFLVPAGIAIVCSLFLVNRLRDTPGSLGLPPVEIYTGELDLQAKTDPDAPKPDFWTILRTRVFNNPIIWFVCVANFFVYVIRYSFLNWAPTYLHEMKHHSLQAAGNMAASYEVAGLVGSLVAGWLTDRFLAGRRAPVCVAYMLATLVFVYAFWKVPQGHPWVDALTLFMVGFCIYGPQFLVGVMVADQSSKEAVATAIGLTGFFGYMSGLFSGYGLGAMVDRYGWDGGFQVLMVCCLAAAVPFAMCWNARPKPS